MVLARLMESRDLVSALGWLGGRRAPQRKQWHLLVLLSLERAVLILAPPALMLILVNFVPPCISLALFELLSLCQTSE